jgi:NADPH2:quinone reductase
VRELWEGEDAHLSASEGAIAKGVVRIDEHPEIDLAVVHVPESWVARAAHRFTVSWTGALHPMAVSGATLSFGCRRSRARARLASVGSMRAAVYYETGGPDVFRYEDVDDPVCGPGEVLVDIEAISIEGGDTLNRAGGEMAGRPHIVGYQCAGTIAEVGEQVTNRAVGQRVVASFLAGSHAERIAVPAVVTWLVPDGLDITAAACVPIAFGTADDCLFEFGRLVAGETVLVQAGAGGVGLAAIQLAKRADAIVLATASSDDKLDRLRAFGLDHGINYREVDLADAARALTGGRGVNLVVDSVGSTLVDSVRALAYRGRCTLVGQAGRDPQPFDASMLMMGNQTVTGVFFGAEITTGRVQAMVARHLEDVAAGRLEVVIDRVFPLAEAGDAHRHVESRQAFGRVVLVP